MSFDAYTTAGQGQNLFQQLCIQSIRDPVNGVDLTDPGGGAYQIGRRWFNRTNQNYWRYAGQGNWVLDSSSTGPILGIDVPAGASPIRPDAMGIVGFTSTAGTITISGTAGGLGDQDINFDVSGGAVIGKVMVDTSSPPGTNPVIPTANQITIEGGTTFPTGLRSRPIQTISLAPSTIDLEIQLAGSNPAVLTANNFGVCQFDSNQFNVNTGFVQLKGGTTPEVLSLTGDDAVVVIPNGAGNINQIGGGAGTGVVTSGITNQINFNVYRWVPPISNNWTPVAAGTTGAGVGTYIKQHGVYSRVGNMVFFTFDLQWSAHTGTGNILITGFPKTFAYANTNYPYIAYIENITVPAGTIQVVFNGTNSTMQGAVQANISATTNSPVALPAAGTICCYGFYFSDDP